ncbi:unnamed protein product [Caenorhabditis nigoni]
MLDSDLEKYKSTRRLGLGAFGEVVLMEHTEYPKIKMAAKIMPSSKTNPEKIRHEFRIHRYLSHENIIKMLDMRQTRNNFFLFLEFAGSGDLFDRIPKDLGMSSSIALHYFKQLIAGMKYMHGKGVVHRDIKPENLLIGKNDTLKICDFGCARKFRNHDDEEVLLQGADGTSHYAAPEVFAQKSYRGPPIDIWSSGVTLMVLLTGQQPWKKADGSSKNYQRWMDGKNDETDAWYRLDQIALGFLQSCLTDDVDERLTIEEIESSPYMMYNYKGEEKIIN